MKLPIFQQSRRSNSCRIPSSTLVETKSSSSSIVDGSNIKSPTSIFWLILHCLCCLISLVLGFRFSRLLFYLLLSTTTTTNFFTTETLPFLSTLNSPSNTTAVGGGGGGGGGVVVGRHGILIRSWPHPDAEEVMKAHRIISRVQREQRVQYGVKNPRTVIAVTPTYVRTFQTLHLTGVMHSLMNVPYDLVWIVVEAGGTTNETASVLVKSGLRTIHVGFGQKMPVSWEDRHKMESKMRLGALRVVREEKLDGIVVFTDDSNMHSMELFDEIQSTKWIGAISVGILAYSPNSNDELSVIEKNEEKNSPVPIQGPACNSSNHLVGWHTFNSVPYEGKSAIYIGDRAIVLPRKLEWAGFVLNSRLVWKEAEDKPDWVKDLDMLAADGEEVESPLSLVKDPSVVEPLGSCGRKVLLWWLRVEARADSKFPAGWIIDPPLEVTVPAKRTPWPDAPPELPANEKLVNIPENTEKRIAKTRSRRSKLRSKRKHEARNIDMNVSTRHSGET